MFGSLNDEIQKFDGAPEAPTRRWARYAGIAGASLVVMLTLFAGILYLK